MHDQMHFPTFPEMVVLCFFSFFFPSGKKITQINEIICEFIILLWPHKDTFQYCAEYRNSCKLCLDTGYLSESVIASFPTKEWPFNIKAK